MERMVADDKGSKAGRWMHLARKEKVGCHVADFARGEKPEFTASDDRAKIKILH